MSNKKKTIKAWFKSLTIKAWFKSLTIKAWFKSLSDSFHHVIYLILWLFASINLFISGDIDVIFTKMESVPNIIISFLIFFAFVTLVVHQFFIYDSFHTMEKNPEKWNLFTNWYNHPIEITIRIVAFIALIGIVGKIPGFDMLVDLIFIETDITSNQKLIIVGSTILFGLLCFWSLGGKIIDGKVKIRYLMTDLTALIFWGLVSKIILFDDNSWTNTLVVVSIMIGSIYVVILSFRILLEYHYTKKIVLAILSKFRITLREQT